MQRAIGTEVAAVVGRALTLHTVAIVTAENGSATVYSPKLTGRVMGVRYARGAAGKEFTAGSTLTMTQEDTSEALLTFSGDAAFSLRPRVGGHDVLGAASELVLGEPLPLVNERIKVVVAGGGAAKEGTVSFIIEG